MKDDQPRPRYTLSFALFLGTFLTTSAQGAIYNTGSIFPISAGLSYSVPLLFILLCHEFGHYIAARLHGVPASLPYFIPLPPPIGMLGTLGAVIFQSGETDRRKLMDIGAAGPLAGIAAAVPLMIYGLAHSAVKVPPPGAVMQEGNSLLYALMKFAVKGEWLPNGPRDVVLHPTAFAAWAGFLVTMLNLIPVGQLDGGHVATAYFGNRYERASRWVHRSLPLVGLVAGLLAFGAVRQEIARAGDTVAVHPLELALPPAMFWMVWYGLLALMRRMSDGVYHPPVDDGPLGRGRRAVFWVAIITFLLVFMPVPFRFGVGPADGRIGGPSAGETSR